MALNIHRPRIDAGAAFFLLLTAALIGATPASAQETGTRIGRNAQAGNAQDAVMMLRIMGECIAARRPQFVRDWLALLPGSRAELELLRREAEDFSLCTEDRQLVRGPLDISFTPALLRRATTASLARRRAIRAPESRPVPPDLDPWFVPELNRAVAAGERINRVQLAAMDFGHCILLRDWSAARALILSDPASPEERAAVGTLAPHLGPCLSDGVTLELTPTSLREIVSEPFLHLLDAAPVPD